MQRPVAAGGEHRHVARVRQHRRRRALPQPRHAAGVIAVPVRQHHQREIARRHPDARQRPLQLARRRAPTGVDEDRPRAHHHERVGPRAHVELADLRRRGGARAQRRGLRAPGDRQRGDERGAHYSSFTPGRGGSLQSIRS